MNSCAICMEEGVEDNLVRCMGNGCRRKLCHRSCYDTSDEGMALFCDTCGSVPGGREVRVGRLWVTARCRTINCFNAAGDNVFCKDCGTCNKCKKYERLCEMVACDNCDNVIGHYDDECRPVPFVGEKFSQKVKSCSHCICSVCHAVENHIQDDHMLCCAGCCKAFWHPSCLRRSNPAKYLEITTRWGTGTDLSDSFEEFCEGCANAEEQELRKLQDEMLVEGSAWVDRGSELWSPGSDDEENGYCAGVTDSDQSDTDDSDSDGEFDASRGVAASGILGKRRASQVFLENVVEWGQEDSDELTIIMVCKDCGKEHASGWAGTCGWFAPIGPPPKFPMSRSRAPKKEPVFGDQVEGGGAAAAYSIHTGWGGEARTWLASRGSAQ